jgi:hypothetical protein
MNENRPWRARYFARQFVGLEHDKIHEKAGPREKACEKNISAGKKFKKFPPSDRGAATRV